jgi:MYXO-CTERM domain-containing protein
VADSVVDPTAADFTITLTATGGCADTVERPLAVLVNADDKLKTSATDSFDAVSSVWTTQATDSQWSHARPTPLDGTWFGNDSGARTDSSVTSPVLTADATAPVSITLSHKFWFEFSGTTYYDGGVIEVTTDGGTTWQDIATLAAASPYNAILTTTSDNPLGGRAAFSKTNTAYPAADTVTLDLGTKLAGQTFQLRFRVATDGGTGAPGWEIDDVAFTGITGTPFPTLVADSGTCDGGEGSGSAMPDAGVPTGPDAGGNPETGDDMGGCCQSQRSPAGSGLLAVAVLGLIARRRRRR